MRECRVVLKHSESYTDQKDGEETICRWKKAFRSRRLVQGYNDRRGSKIGTVWTVEARIEYRVYRLHLKIESHVFYTDYDQDDIKKFKLKMTRLLEALEIQSDEVYLALEHMMDTRIDCCIVAA